MKRSNIRWWPAVVVLALYAIALCWFWLFSDTIRQDRFLNSVFTGLLAVLLLVTWLLFFSRAAWKTRLSIFATLVVLTAGFFTAFRIGEVSGDLVPHFELKVTQSSPGADDPSTLPSATEAGSYEAQPSSPHPDYPQFLGPDRTAIITGNKLNPDWETHPPRLLWKQSIGAGWSAFSVSGNRALTQEQRGNKEGVVCYDLTSGQTLWSHFDQARYQTVLAGTGPRATPTISDSTVYTLGATGILNCLDLRSGTVYWSKDIVADNDATIPQWGMSGSPLLLDSLVVVSAGGQNGRSLVAYHKDTGALIWAGGDDLAGYSSPMIASVLQTPHILIFNNSHVVAHEPRAGKVLWKFPWIGQTEKVAQPVVLPGGRVFVTTGYGVGSKLLRIEKVADGAFKVSTVWESKRLKAKFTNVVHRDGFIYGLDDGILVCLDLADGKRRWKNGRYGHGQLLMVDGLLLVVTEKGDVVLVAAQPDAFHELARMKGIQGKTWNNPTLAGPYLLIRNSKEAACFELRLAGT